MQITKLLGMSWVVVVLAGVVACGGGAPAEPATPAEATASSGDEEEYAEEEGVEEEAEEEAAPSGPGQITLVTKVANDVVVVPVQVLGADGAVAAEGNSGTQFTLAAGSYTAVASISDEAVMLDKPSVRHRFDVSPGDSRTETVRFPYARVKFAVTINGRAHTKGTVALKRNGAVVATIDVAAADFATITPGRYEGIVKSGNTEISLPEVLIPEESTRTIPLTLTL